MDSTRNTIEGVTDEELTELRSAIMSQYDIATGNGDADRAKRLRSLLGKINDAEQGG